MDSQNKSEKIKILYNLLTELEKIGCFEINTDEDQRMKITKFLLKVIENSLEDELLEKTSGSGHERD